MNLLIAMFSKTFDLVYENAEREHFLKRSELLLEWKNGNIWPPSFNVLESIWYLGRFLCRAGGEKQIHELDISDNMWKETRTLSRYCWSLSLSPSLPPSLPHAFLMLLPKLPALMLSVGGGKKIDWVYYESKREPKIRGMNKCRCDERLQTKTKEFTRLPYTGLVLENDTCGRSLQRGIEPRSPGWKPGILTVRRLETHIKKCLR